MKITKKVSERNEDGWEGRRKVRKGVELGEDSIWQGGQSVVVEVMKRNESVTMNEMK